MSRERALMACKPYSVPSRMIEHFPDLIGRVAPGNGSTETHFTDKDFGKAIAMPASEAQLLRDIVLQAGPDRPVEVGAYVGWSTVHILSGSPMYPNQFVLDVIDLFTESKDTPDKTEERFWQNIERVGGVEQVRLVRAASPAILPVVKPRHGWDFAFIDGAHTGGQPMQDIQGLLPCLTDDAIVVWHDAWIVPVKEAIAWLGRQGWTNVELPTANRMTVSYHGDRPHWLDDIEQKAREYVLVTHG